MAVLANVKKWRHFSIQTDSNFAPDADADYADFSYSCAWMMISCYLRGIGIGTKHCCHGSRITAPQMWYSLLTLPHHLDYCSLYATASHLETRMTKITTIGLVSDYSIATFSYDCSRGATVAMSW